jgi:glycosyltransferase involved in cell wall biosynthesis
MSVRISVVVPNHNGSATIGTCLQSLFSSSHPAFEVIVVDDCSSDKSVDIIRQFPCRLIRLDRHAGASRARNAGAEASSGDVLFFIDADCVVQEDTLARVADSVLRNPDRVIGGSYTPVAYDDGFYSTFQSVFINYSELKNHEPDYIASHAMVIGKELFVKSGGFPEAFMPILEDVEFSHRLKRSGVRLLMDRSILVEHIFNFDLKRSLRNAMRKSRYWTGYSLAHSDITRDSGTASHELKINAASACAFLLLLLCFMIFRQGFFLFSAVIVGISNLLLNRRLIGAFFRAKGQSFGILATLYYCFIYPWPVIAGGVSGTVLYVQSRWAAS